MKVFISWSGEQSRHVAEYLRDWLKLIIQSVEPWLSASDIQPGARWNSDIAKELEASQFGILCMTPENLTSPWILFEAGALAKAIDKGRVCPYLIGVDYSGISGPLVQFQALKADKESTWKLVLAINSVAGKLAESQLKATFDRFWPDLEEALAKRPTGKVRAMPARSDRDVMEEVLQLVRGVSRDITTLRLVQDPRYATSKMVVKIDLSDFGREAIFVPSDSEMIFQDFLDMIWIKHLGHLMKGFTYGTTWILVNSETGSRIEKRGERDERPLSSVGIVPGVLLRAIRLGD